MPIVSNKGGVICTLKNILNTLYFQIYFITKIPYHEITQKDIHFT